MPRTHRLCLLLIVPGRYHAPRFFLSRAAPSATASKSLRLCKPASGHAVACGPFAPLRVLAACSRALCASYQPMLSTASPTAMGSSELFTSTTRTTVSLPPGVIS